MLKTLAAYLLTEKSDCCFLSPSPPRGVLFVSFFFLNSLSKMAPLLGRKPYPLTKPLAEPPGPGDEVYIIEHTKEAFRNKEYPLKT